MSRSLNVYRSTNDLTYSELPPPDYGDLEPFAEDAVNKENALEFYRFELAILQVSGAQDQLQTYAATQENFAKDGQQTENQDDPVWTQIQKEVKNEVTQVSSKIPDVDTTDVSEQKVIDDPVIKVSRYTDCMARTGLTDQSFSTSLLPSSTSEWIAEVARKTGLNTLIGGWIRRMFSPPSAEPTADTENWRQTVRADALYGLLAAQHCCEKSHSALLQLSGWDDSLEGKNVFQMFLSCCSDSSWQRATCLFESSMPDNNRGPQIDICSKISTARLRQVPLLLSFNDDRLWTTKGARRILSELERSPNRVDLETLLTQGDLKTSDLEDSIRKFRFAHLLASSLCSLYFGPWIQQDWSSHSVHIIPNRDARPVEMLDEAYVTCLFNTDWRQIHTPPVPSQETSSTEACPRFFLSLAQLLVDIANGERSHRSSSQDDFDSWYKLLVDEVRKNMDDQLMGSYWSAIQGCLLYLENYDNHGQDSLDEDKDKKLRAREVIYEHVVRHLQKNLNFWREQQKGRSVDEADSGSETSQPHGHAQRSVGAQHIGYGSSATALSPPRPTAGPTVETKFTLWSDHDDDYTIIQRPTTEPSKSSFISHMKTFRDTYIETLPEPTGNGDGPKRVRVAIIDTGLYIEEAELDRDGDPFLAHPDVQSRVVDRRNFFSPDDTEPDPDDWEDEHGHGTHVARLVLRFAPRADVVVAKICNSKTLKKTKTTQLVNALKWAGGRDGGQADIINLSFSLGSMPEPEVVKVIKDLISDNKLIFVAASNTGGYGSRLWPASCFGVFAIHATNEFGTPDANMNPPPLPTMDNFATFGCDVESYWKGHHRLISGTSFATPVAAAIGANILEFARRTQPEIVANGLTRYSAIRALFHDYMTPNNVDGHYHCFRLWAKGLWDGDRNHNGIHDVLWKVSR